MLLLFDITEKIYCINCYVLKHLNKKIKDVKSLSVFWLSEKGTPKVGKRENYLILSEWLLSVSADFPSKRWKHDNTRVVFFNGGEYVDKNYLFRAVA